MEFSRYFYVVLFLGIASIIPANADGPPPPPWAASGFAAQFPVPLPATGSCTAHTKYKITSVKDLYADAGDLECIFAAGKAPVKEPLGYSYGYLLAAANTAFYDLFAEIFYQGDFTVRTQCQSEYLTIGWLSIGGVKPGTALWSVGNRKEALGVDVAPGEYPLSSENAIIMDFTKNFKDLCHPQGNESPLGLIGFSPFMNSVWPLNQFIDLAVIVGKDSDGGLISLNKAYIIPKDPEDGAATILFYATKSFDDEVLPSFNYGDEIEVPLSASGEEVVEYYRGSVEALLKRLNPARIVGDYSEAYLGTLRERSPSVRAQKTAEFPIPNIFNALLRSSDGQGDAPLIPAEFMKTLSDMNIDGDTLRQIIDGGDTESLEALVKRFEQANIGGDGAEQFTTALEKAGVNLEKLVGALNVVDVPSGDVQQAREQMRGAIQSTIARAISAPASEHE